MERREALAALAGAVPLAGLGAPELERVWKAVKAAGQQFQPKFFAAHEWETVRILVDIVIPRDERSGSATDAGVPEFMDFVLTDQPNRQTSMRGGLAWLDTQCRGRFGKNFKDCAAAERATLLDAIAWPRKALPEMNYGVAFFNSFRDLTASAFFSSKLGVADLQYMGNTFVQQWNGCPEPALRKLGVSYAGD